MVIRVAWQFPTPPPIKREKEKKSRANVTSIPQNTSHRICLLLPPLFFLPKTSSPIKSCQFLSAMPRTLRIKSQLQRGWVMDSKKNSDQGTQGWACSQLIHYRKPTLCVIDPHCSLVLPAGSLKIIVTFYRQSTALPFVPCHIHHRLSTYRGHIIGLYYCAGVQIRVPVIMESKILRTVHHGNKAEGPFQSSYIYTHIYTHTCAHKHTHIINMHQHHWDNKSFGA